ncbi:sigma-70 family RNA polymerase sigma factor [Luteolibacter sp. GHJ8]|uniref:Sigma-70 family RNA polymerase sigma factor n=1 Tax=Luteolibacter rhizosphaerae TaxID=2989719 RepID=A0ABT3G8G5_9BACT|nr:sigma-70 family RNA polymerase sigma factor [Luteolibacter rhizosphaerae]MCW1916144.1 sigma-70 family RNA polymerase sigma factor [Luteolibacter rhizosphaerae]
MNDQDLIREFAATRSEQAFRRLVDRHCDLVFSVAGRVTRDPDLARDVSQQVFSKLAAKPASVPANVPLAAWLHRTCRSLAIDLVRSEEARRKRESAHSHPFEMNSEPTPDWSRLEPVIDSLIDELPEMERRAVLLRFYEKRSHGAIGAALGLSEEAARKRIDRALERLRSLLSKRGIATTSAALATILPAHATAPAPAGFAASLSSTALSTAATTAVSSTSIIAIIMSHKAIVAGASLLLLAGVTAIAVPRMRDGSDSTPSATSSTTGSAPFSGSALPSAASTGKQRSNETQARLTAKYGDARTKLSAHLHGEMIALLEDAISVMEIAHSMKLGEQFGDDPAESLGELGEKLNLTEEQKKTLGQLENDSFKRDGEEARSLISLLKKEPASLMEYLLASDAVKRGEMTPAAFAELEKTLNIPEDDLSMAIGDTDSMESDSLDDEAFVEAFLAILDEEQKRIFQDGLAARTKEEKTEAEQEFSTLEEIEKQVASGRKMIGGAKQLMEGITDGGILDQLQDK